MKHFGWSGFRSAMRTASGKGAVPTAMEFTNGRDDWYTLLTEGQGLLIPNTWKTELGKLSFDGRFETSGGYMRGLAR